MGYAITFFIGFIAATWARESDLIRVFRNSGKLPMIFHKNISKEEIEKTLEGLK